MINGGDVAIDNTIIHNHSMIIFISMLHFCNDGLSGGQRQLLSGAYAGVSGEWWLDLLLGGFEMMMRWWWWWWDLLWWCCFAAAAAAAVIDTQVVGRWLWCCCCSACGAGAAVEVMAAVHLWEAKLWLWSIDRSILCGGWSVWREFHLSWVPIPTYVSRFELLYWSFKEKNGRLVRIPFVLRTDSYICK